MPVGGIFGKAQGHAQGNQQNLVGQLLGGGIQQASDALAQFKERRKAQVKENNYIRKVVDLSLTNEVDQGRMPPEVAEMYRAQLDEAPIGAKRAILDALAMNTARNSQAAKDALTKEAHDLAIRRGTQAADQAEKMAPYEELAARQDIVRGDQAIPQGSQRTKINQQLIEQNKLAIQAQQQAIEVERQRIASGAPTADEAKYATERFDKMRTEPQVRKYEEALAAKDALAANVAEAQRTGQLDIQLVVGFMKAMDPDSAVREGEFATAKNSGSLPDSIVNAWNKVKDGKFLTAEQAKGFLRAAEVAITGYQASAERVAETYKRQAAATGHNPDLIQLPDYSQSAAPSAPQPELTPEQEAAIPLLSNAEAQKQVDTTGRPLLYRDANGKQWVAEPSKER